MKRGKMNVAIKNDWSEVVNISVKTGSLVFKNLFTLWIKEVAVVLISGLILAHIFCPRIKDFFFSLLFVLDEMANAICALMLFLLNEGKNMAVKQDGAVPLQYLNTEVAWYYSTLSSTGSQ